ncbi:S-adenosyl-L-methionine-dependent methyltransferase [Wilcoxina mikolae CBS 423.85]|nr:S-adenosyl-L-methionine-dependent methyltransferase [Wilcoxina mikolae CBS 423.85]
MAKLNTSTRDEPQTNDLQQPPAKRRRRDSESQDRSSSSSESDSSDSSSDSSDDSSSDDSSSDDSSSDDSSSDDSSSDDSSSSSSSKELPTFPEDEAEEDTPPPSVILYTDANPPSGQLYWYWTQRQRYFSRYSEGIWMTPDSWFEVTPEAVAAKITSHMFPRASTSSNVVMDAFCGVGGNSISFALSPSVKKVIAIDTSADAIACARHNAAIYGVSHKIEFLCADFFALVDTRWKFEEISAVFLSPPWGGPTYKDNQVFDLEQMQPYTVSYLVERSREVCENIALYLPRTSDLNQLAALIGDEEEMEVVHYCLGRKSKAIGAYFGTLNERVKMARENGWK